MPRLATTLHTQRLRLEPFDARHLDGLNAMNRMPEVMRFLGGQPETQDQTASVITRVQRCWAAWGTSWWAFIETSSGQVAGAGCIQYLRRDAAAPEDLESLVGKPLEIGWRLNTADSPAPSDHAATLGEMSTDSSTGHDCWRNSRAGGSSQSSC